ncbi:hypothetical protein QYM36_008794 [Artemia franciscana]|uniref:USP domain-containing protein n=1 Tax=Artemia franciscana TaxID=6661 RepID=A0AA88LAN9_ARTSF|nr:hypothetical protein QYM36_008794 [Artemia franciscana]
MPLLSVPGKLFYGLVAAMFCAPSTKKLSRAVIEAFKQYISTHDQQTERFETFPPVICLLLKRYDSKLTKIDDRFEFSEDLDLTTFLTGPDQESKATYTLYVVIAHKGLQYTGHYVSFIKPKGDRDGHEYESWKPKLSLVSTTNLVKGIILYKVVFFKHDHESWKPKLSALSINK